MSPIMEEIPIKEMSEFEITVKAKLEEYPLDSSKWLPILKELHYKTLTSIQNAGKTGAKEILSRAKTNAEKKALENFLKELKQEKDEKQEEKKDKKFQKDQEALQAVDKKVKKSLKQMGQDSIARLSELNTVKDRSNSSGVFLSEFEKKISAAERINKASSIIERGSFSDKEILENASGGLALEGIYWTGSVTDSLQKREQLLAVPDSHTLSNSQQAVSEQTQELESRKEEDHFVKSMERLGASATASVSGSGYGVSINASLDASYASNEENEEKTNASSCYTSKMKYMYVPQASCFLGLDQLRLSKAALGELKIINRSKEENKIDQCLKFFERFGSHANQGQIHFGGIFYWKACAEGFDKCQLKEVKKQTSAELKAFASVKSSWIGVQGGAGASVSKTSSNEDASKEHTSSLNINTLISKNGGPTETNDAQQWMEGLAKNNKTWSVIDRGLKLIPVWQILKENHAEDFKDCSDLAKCLEEAYNLQVMLQSIINWNAGYAEKHLTNILTLNLPVEEKFIANKHFQDFLLKIARAKTCPRTELRLKFLLSTLFKRNIYNVSFPDRSKVAKWICQSTNEMLSLSYQAYIANLKQEKDEPVDNNLQDNPKSQEVEFTFSEFLNDHKVNVKSECKPSDAFLIELEELKGILIAANTSIKTADYLANKFETESESKTGPVSTPTGSSGRQIDGQVTKKSFPEAQKAISLKAKCDEDLAAFDKYLWAAEFTHKFGVEDEANKILEKARKLANDNKFTKLELEKSKQNSPDQKNHECHKGNECKIFVDKISKDQTIFTLVFGIIKTRLTKDVKLYKTAKTNIEKQILKQHAENENFDDLVDYVKDPKKGIEDFIRKSIESQLGKDPRILSNCFQDVSFQVLESAKKSTEIVLTTNGDLSTWMKMFSSELKEKFGQAVEIISSFLENLLPNKDERNKFSDLLKDSTTRKAMINHLENVTIVALHKISTYLENSFAKRLADDWMLNEFGCFHQCQFCFAICSESSADHTNQHVANLHYPLAITNAKYFQIENSVKSTCGNLFESDESAPDKRWKMQSDCTEVHKYWKWFFIRFESNLKRNNSMMLAENAKIPSAWKSITKAEAIASLNL